MKDDKGSSAVPKPSGYTFDSHSHVSRCSIVTLQCHHEHDIGGAVSVGGIVWFLEVGVADWGMIARVSGFAVFDHTGVASSPMELGADPAGVVAGGTSLGWVPKLLTFVALGRRAE